MYTESMETSRTPLNGVKTHPLKAASIDALRRLTKTNSVGSWCFNPGVKDRLLREDLIVIFNAHGSNYVAITDAGRERLAQIDVTENSTA
jgi:hypothetical protein